MNTPTLSGYSAWEIRRRNAVSVVQMRRAIAMAASSGLVLGGAIVASGAAAAATARAHTAVHVTAAGTRIVFYAGYQLTVPASWPVYRLEPDQDQDRPRA